jgi:hypothetical protein
VERRFLFRAVAYRQLAIFSRPAKVMVEVALTVWADTQANQEFCDLVASLQPNVEPVAASSRMSPLSTLQPA